MEPKCASQLLLGLQLVTRRAAIGQFFPLYLVTVPEVFAKVTRPSFLPSKTANDSSAL